jgi:hypothetical protein
MAGSATNSQSKGSLATFPCGTVFQDALVPVLNGLIIGVVCGLGGVYGRGGFQQFSLATMREAWVPRILLMFFAFGTLGWGLWFLLLSWKPGLHQSEKRIPKYFRRQVEYFTTTAFHFSAGLIGVLLGALSAVLISKTMSSARSLDGQFARLAFGYSNLALLAMAPCVVQAGFKSSGDKPCPYYRAYGLALIFLAAFLVWVGCSADWQAPFVVKITPAS